MNNYVAAAIIMVFIAILIPQSAVQTVNHKTVSECEVLVEEAKEAAKHEGYFTQSIIDTLNDGLEDAGVDVARVEESFTTSIKYRENSRGEVEMIDYEVKIPIDEVVAGGSFFGLSEDENKYMHTFRGSVPSERLPR